MNYTEIDTSGVNSARKLKRATIKEELVALTGDAIDAIILNQFIKYQASAGQIEKYIEEERARFASDGKSLNLESSRGWFYKKAEQVSEETMLGLAKPNMGARIKKLIAAGWIAQRDNPFHKWDKTKQYRVDLRAINNALKELGYCLDGWLITQIDTAKPQSDETKHRSNDSLLRGERNETAIPSSTKQDVSLQETNSAGGAVVAALIAQGIAPKVAAQLFADYPDECGKQLAALPSRKGTNRAGLLRRSIEGRWNAPEAAQSTVEFDQAFAALSDAERAALEHEADALGRMRANGATDEQVTEAARALWVQKQGGK